MNKILIRNKELMKQSETECGFNPDKFAELVRADEREACAKVCEDYDDEYDVHTRQTAEGIALEIRARGNE